MTIGALALTVLETAPIVPEVAPLAAQNDSDTEAIITATAVPVDPDRQNWRKVIIHTAAEGGDMVERCHFVIDGREIIATPHWRNQRPTRHVNPYSRAHDWTTDIGVCLKSDYASAAPSAEEVETLARLVLALQGFFGIDDSRVAYHSQLNGANLAPSRQFRAALAERLPGMR
jgi:hypothetical protein